MQSLHPLLSPEWYTGGILYLDFSAENKALSQLDPTDPRALGAYTEQLRKDAGAKLSIGKYGEDRTIYQQSGFQGAEARTVHLGLDLNLPAETELHLPLDGNVVGLENNMGAGNYGPTVIIEHDSFFSLYGHLSNKTLTNIKKGQHLKAGDIFAHVGTESENGGWPTHVHLQLIMDMGKYKDDYPGVCAPSDAEYYLKNCPDPSEFISLS